MKALTYKYVQDYINSQKCKLISTEYKDIDSKLKVLCKHNHEYLVSFYNFRKGNNCNVCSKNQKFDYSYVKSYIENINYKILSETYKNANSKLSVICPNGHQIEKSFYSFRIGIGCGICQKNAKLNYEYIKTQIEKEGFSLISESYNNSTEKLKIKCNNGHEVSITWNSFQQGSRCIKCMPDIIAKKLMLKPAYLKKKSAKDGYEIVNAKDYKNNRQKIEFICPKKHCFEMTWANFHTGHRCYMCEQDEKDSKGVREIIKYLTQSEVGFIREKKYPNCINKQSLPFDFYITQYNCLIEFQGEQHYKSVQKFGGEDKFKLLQLRDQIKTQFCIDNDIPLLVIPYTDKNIPHTISEFLDTLPRTQSDLTELF